MARILFIKCSCLTESNFQVPFPLGIMYLAGSLRKDGHDVRIVDLRLENNGIQGIVRSARDFSPDVVGLSALTMEAESLHSTAKAIKEALPDVPVIAGGPHPSSFTEDVLSDPSIDYVVLGEGEETAKDLVNSIQEGTRKENIAGIAYKRDKAIVLTGGRSYTMDLDSIPFPSWDLIDIKKYFVNKSHSPLGDRRYMSVFTSRGCPYKCIYCHNIFGKGFRARSPEGLLDEMEEIHQRYGIEEFDVEDDIFNLDVKRSHRIFDLIIKSGHKFKLSFPNGLRADRLDADLLKKMKAAGVNHISVAIESTSPRIQKLMKKNLNLDLVTKAIDDCYRLNIFTRGYFMLGFPTETEEEVKETIHYALRSHLHMALFFIVVPFKGTELDQIVKEKLRERPDFIDYDYLKWPFNISDVDDEKLFELQRYAYQKFYLNPVRLANIVRAYPRKLQLVRYIPILMRKVLSSKRGNKKNQFSSPT